MKRLFLMITLITVIIGIIGVGLMYIFKSNTVITFITRERVEMTQTWIYKYDFHNYIENIRNTLETPELTLQLPTRTWQWGGLDAVVNDLAYIVNVFVLVVNIMLYPLRIGALVVRILLVISGINVNVQDPSNPLNWLVTLLQTLNGINVSILYI